MSLNPSISPALAPAGAGAPARVSAALVALLAGLASGSTLASNILLPSLPGMAKAMGVPTAALGPTLSAFFAAFALGQLVVGPLSDRFGRRAVVLPGLLVFIAGSLWCAAAGSLNELIAARVLQALGACAASVLARAIARDLFEGAALARIFSFLMVAMACAPGFSPLLGGLLDQAFGWQAPFILVAGFGVGIGLAYLLMLGETHKGPRTPFDLRGIAAGYRDLIGDRRFIAPGVTSALILGGLYGMFTGLPAIIVEGLGQTPIALGLFFAGTVFVVFGAGIAAPRLAARLGPVRAISLGLCFALAGGASMLALALSGMQSLVLVTVTCCIFLFGMGTVSPLATATALGPFGARAGLASALLGFLQMAAAALGAAAVTAGLAPALASLGAVLTAISLAALLLTPFRR